MADNKDWQEWTDRFEQLLEQLEFTSAITHYDPAESTAFTDLSYLKLQGNIEKLSHSLTYPPA